VNDEEKAEEKAERTELLLLARSTKGEVVLARREAQLTQIEVKRHGKMFGEVFERIGTVEDQIVAGVLEANRAIEPREPEPHDTDSPGELPPMRAPAASITNEVVQSTTRESLRVMASSAATTAAETKAQTPIIAANAAETAKQTPIMEKVQKSTTTAQWLGVANFLSVLIGGVILVLVKSCQVPPPVIYAVPSIAAPAPAPAAAPAPARPPSR